MMPATAASVEQMTKQAIRMLAHVDAGPARGLGVAADRVDVPAEAVRLSTKVSTDDEARR